MIVATYIQKYRGLIYTVFASLIGYFVGNSFFDTTQLSLILFSVFTLFFVIKPTFGFFLFLSFFYFTPDIGNIVSVPLFKSISVATFLSFFLIFLTFARTIFKRESLIIRSPLNGPFAVLVLSYILSDTFGYIWGGYEFRLGSLFTFIMTFYPFILFLVIIYLSRNMSKKENLLKIIAVFSFIPALIGIMEWYYVGFARSLILTLYNPTDIVDVMSGYQYTYTYRSSSLYNRSPNLFGVFTSFMAILSLALFIYEKKRGFKFVWIFLFTLNAIAQFYSQSRSALAALLGGIVIVYYFSSRNMIIFILHTIRKNIFIAIVLFVLVFVSIQYFASGSHFFNRLGVHGDFSDHSSAITHKLNQLQRGSQYSGNVTYFNPIFGIGWSNFVGFINDFGWVFLYTKVGLFGIFAEIYVMICAFNLGKRTLKLSKGTSSASIPIFLIYFVLIRVVINIGGVYWAEERISQLYWIIMGLCFALYNEQVSKIDNKKLYSA